MLGFDSLGFWREFFGGFVVGGLECVFSDVFEMVMFVLELWLGEVLRIFGEGY